MKDIRLGLRQVLLDDPEVSALVGGFRVHPVRLPQGQRDASLVLARISESGHYVMEGSAGLAQARVQADSWATHSDAAASLANAAYDALSGFRGVVSWGGNSPPDSLELRGVFLDQGREDYDATANMFRVSRDYIVFYEES